MTRRLFLLLVLLFAGAPLARAEAVEDQVVRVHVSKKEVDKSAPWQFEEVQQQSYLGVVLDGGRILTSAFAVADAAFLEVQRFGTSRRVEAEVLRDSGAVDVLSKALFGMIEPAMTSLSNATWVLYWSGFVAHIVLASETSMVSVSMPVISIALVV